MTENYLIGIGATKSGSSALTSFLNAHPQINESLITQPNFFLSRKANETPKWGKKFDDLFNQRSNTSNYNFDFSPDYLVDPNASSLIKKNLGGKNLKLICILRHPVSRFKSWFSYGKQIDLVLPTETFEEFLSKQTIKDSATPYNAMVTGKYSNYLKKYYRLFSHNQIYILFQEQLISNPKQTMVDLCEWLSIDGNFYNDYEFYTVNKTIELSSSGSKILKHYSYFHKLMNKLVIKFPSLSKVLTPAGRKTSSIIKRILAKKKDEASVMQLDALYEYYRDEKENLERLINKKSPW